MGIFSIGNWLVFVLATFIIQHFTERKKIREKKVFSHLDGYIKKLWLVFAISIIVATLICFKLRIVPPPIILLLTGVATTTTGLLIKFNPLVIGGLTFFVFSVAATFVSSENTLIITAAAIICGYLIPGYLLKSAKEQ